MNCSSWAPGWEELGCLSGSEQSSCGPVLVGLPSLAGTQVEVSPELFSGQRTSCPGRVWKQPEVSQRTEWRTVEDRPSLDRLGSKKPPALVWVCGRVSL